MSGVEWFALISAILVGNIVGWLLGWFVVGPALEKLWKAVKR